MTLPCTGIMLVHTDAPTVWQGLRSLAWAEQLIVLDQHSGIDPSRFAAFPNLSHLSVTAPISDFAAVRNGAMTHVSTPWCFFLDSDEVVDPLSPVQLSQLRALMTDVTISGLTVKRSDMFLQKKLSYGEAGHQPLIRFLRPMIATWVGRAHEIPIVSGLIRESSVTITHYSHKSINSFLADVSKYAKIVASERRVSPTTNVLQMLTFPPLKFLYDLVLLGGILDGWRGVVYASCMSLHSLLVRIYWYEQHTHLVSPPTAGRQA